MLKLNKIQEYDVTKRTKKAWLKFMTIFECNAIRENDGSRGKKITIFG